MLEELKVKKWGGENAAELTKSPQNVLDDYKKGIKQVVVVSAIRSKDFNTTDNLIKIGELLNSQANFSQIEKELFIIKDFHFTIIDEKISGNTKDIKDFIEKEFLNVGKIIENWLERYDKIFPTKKNDYSINTDDGLFSIIGFGEILSAYIQEKIINNLKFNGLNAEFVDLKGLVSNKNKVLKEQEIFKNLSLLLSKKVLSVLEKGNVPIIPGYIPGFEDGIENAIGRGYSDATAGMTSVGLSKFYDITLEIQKSVLGLLSSDPKIVTGGKTKLIDQIDYLTAKEIVGVRGAQAKLLHNQVLRRELQEAGIKIRLFDPFSESKGTLISKVKKQNVSGVEYIGGRKNVIFFSISSGRMHGEGILAYIFSIVKKYTTVDIISTSETEISFTIDSGLPEEKLIEMSNKIRKVLDIKEDGYENFVKYEKNKALVFCIGQKLYHNKGILGKTALAFSKGDINIEMVSQGTMERAMVFGINGDELEKAINVLHDELIEK